MFLQLLVLLPLLVANGTSGYKHVGGKHGVEVFRLEKSPNIDLIAEGDIEAPPANVRTVLLDYAHARALSDHVAESRVQPAAGRLRYGTSLVAHLHALGLLGPRFCA